MQTIHRQPDKNGEQKNDSAIMGSGNQGLQNPNGTTSPTRTVLEQGSGHGPSGTFRAAFHEIDITPDACQATPVVLQGLAGVQRRATETSDPLKMQVLLIEDQQYTKLLVVTADLIGFDSEVVQAVRAYAADWGIDPAGIILNASHTHYAPGTVSRFPPVMGSYHADYAREIGILIKSSLRHLYFKLETAQLAWTAAETRIGVNRRLRRDDRTVFGPNPDAAYDTHTPIIRVHLTESDQTILLVRHSCHPTGLGHIPVISADYPGRMRKALIDSGHAQGVMFLQGAAGTSKQTAARLEPDVRFADSVADSWANGDRLADCVVQQIRRPMCHIQGTICAILQKKSMEFSHPPHRHQIEQVAQNPNANPLVLEWAQGLLARYPRGDFPIRATMEIQAIRLGSELTFITLPGEPAAELSENVNSLFSSSSPLFFLGYTNGVFGYLPTNKMLAEGGYESEMSHLVYGWPSKLTAGPETALSEFAYTVARAFDPDEPKPIYGRHHEFQSPEKAFFVLSTGRCGTMTLANILNTASNARVYHHPQPDPIGEALQAFDNEIDKGEAFWRYRSAPMRQSWSMGQIHGETDLLMTPFADAIAKELPEAKFIVLVRDPRDFVRSGMRRKYYVDHPWDFGRLRPRADTVDGATWDRWDPFEKVCWLWNETYERINKMVKQMGTKRVRIVRMEDIIADPSVVRDLFGFLELEGYDPTIVDQIMRKKLNAQRKGDFPPSKNWSRKQRDTQWRICGAVAMQFAYDQNPIARPTPTKPRLSESAVSPAPVKAGATKTGGVPSDHKGKIAKDSVITCPFTIGSYSNIMGKAIIKGNRACTIGRYCALGWGIHIITSHHDISRANVQIDMQQRHGFRNIWLSNGDVNVGNNVWIGDNAVILSGVTVGDGAVIGSGAIVMNDLPPFGVAAGNPAHVVKMRFAPKIIDQLLDIQWWNWTEEKIAHNQALFELDLTDDPNLDLSRIISD